MRRGTRAAIIGVGLSVTVALTAATCDHGGGYYDDGSPRYMAGCSDSLGFRVDDSFCGPDMVVVGRYRPSYLYLDDGDDVIVPVGQRYPGGWSTDRPRGYDPRYLIRGTSPRGGTVSRFGTGTAYGSGTRLGSGGAVTRRSRPAPTTTRATPTPRGSLSGDTTSGRKTTTTTTSKTKPR